MNDTELAWLAGWLEGEGTFHCSTDKRGYTRLSVRGVSVDLEVIQIVQRKAGQGRIYGPYKYGTNKQFSFQWAICGRHAAAEFMRMLRPHMSSRRQAQIDAALAKGAPS